LEETGYETEQWEKLGKTSSNPAIMSNFTHLYIAENCTSQTKPNLDGHEDIDVHTLPLETFFDLVKTGVVHHAIVLAAVSRLLLHRPDLT